MLSCIGMVVPGRVPMIDNESEEGVDWHADGDELPTWLIVSWVFVIVALILIGIGLVAQMAMR